MDRCDFEIVERTPLFVLLNEPLDTRNLLYKWLWYGAGRLISSSDGLGAVAGRRLYPLEIKLTSRRKESPPQSCCLPPALSGPDGRSSRAAAPDPAAAVKAWWQAPRRYSLPAGWQVTAQESPIMTGTS